MGPVSLYEVEYRPEAAREGAPLPRRVKESLRDRFELLRSGPFTSYPWLRVKEVRELPGVWRFHLARWRVFYWVDGRRIIVGMIEPRPTSYTAKTFRELARRKRSRG